VRATWFSQRALVLHLTVVAVVGGCLALGWWQFSRALGGNSLSWVYTFEWPFFAVYAVYMWWKLLHEPLAETREAERTAKAVADEQPVSLAELVQELDFDPYDDEADPELAAYNRYLAGLHAADQERARSPKANHSASAS
jgi:DNA-binding transcriptional regulator of glucitol operon